MLPRSSWAAWGLARAARYLDAPYGGGRYDEVVDRTGIRELLARLASALAVRRSDDGGWPTDLAHPDACPASETSATGLITYMLAKGVNEGWLDRAAFTPVALKALSLLLAVSEALRLPDADLAALEDVAARPIDRSLIGRTWIVAFPEGCDAAEILLTNAGTSLVHARLETLGGTLAGFESADVPSRGAAILRIAGVAAGDAPFVSTLRADGDLAVYPRAVRGEAVRYEDGTAALFRFLPRRAGAAVPLWTALAGGEARTLVTRDDGFLALGGRNMSPQQASLIVEIRSADEALVKQFTLELPSGGAVLETDCVPGASRVTFSNASEGSALVPLAFAQPD